MTAETDDVEVGAMSAMSAVSVVTLHATVDIDEALAVTELIAIAVEIVAGTEAVTEAVTADAAVTDVIRALTLVVTRDHRPVATASTPDTHAKTPDRQSAIAGLPSTNAPDPGQDRQRDAPPDLHAVVTAARQRTVATTAPRQRATAMDTGPTATRRRAPVAVTVVRPATERTVPMATRTGMLMAARRWRTATTNEHDSGRITLLTSALLSTPQLLLF